MASAPGNVYFKRYLKIAPFSLALWRSVEAQVLAKYPLKRPVLDIGCGFGEFGGVFFSSQVEVGVDIDHKDILRAAATGKYKETIVADARKLPFKDNTFGTIISISTLEHIPDNSKVFREAFRVLKPGGFFYYTVPTTKLYDGLLIVKILNFLGLKGLSHIYYRAYNKAFKHVFIPSTKVWLNLAEKAGFKIEKVQGTFSQSALILFELCLPLAIPSQLSRIFLGRRLKFGTSLKKEISNPLAHFVRADPSFMANIFVAAQKLPKSRKAKNAR